MDRPSVVEVDYEDTFPFYRCFSRSGQACGRIFTVLEERERLKGGEEATRCPVCGVPEYTPTNRRFLELFLPRVLWLYCLAFFGRVKVQCASSPTTQ